MLDRCTALLAYGPPPPQAHYGTPPPQAYGTAPPGGNLRAVALPTAPPMPVPRPDAARFKPVLTLPTRPGAVEAVLWAPDGKTLATSSEDKTVRIWDAATGTTVRTLTESPAEAIGSVDYAPDGKSLVVGYENGTIRRWDAATGDTSHVMGTTSLPPRTLAYAPDGKTLAIALVDGTVQIVPTP